MRIRNGRGFTLVESLVVLVIAALVLALVGTSLSRSISGAEMRNAARKVAQWDMYLRWAVVIGIPISVGYSLYTDRLTDHPWVAAKLLIFAGLVLCGIMVRNKIGGFFGTLVKLRKGEPVSDADNEAMIASLGVVRRYVFTIWVGVFLAGIIGTFNRSGIVYTDIVKSAAALF